MYAFFRRSPGLWEAKLPWQSSPTHRVMLPCLPKHSPALCFCVFLIIFKMYIFWFFLFWFFFDIFFGLGIFFSGRPPVYAVMLLQQQQLQLQIVRGVTNFICGRQGISGNADEPPKTFDVSSNLQQTYVSSSPTSCLVFTAHLAKSCSTISEALEELAGVIFKDLTAAFSWSVSSLFFPAGSSELHTRNASCWLVCQAFPCTFAVSQEKWHKWVHLWVWSSSTNEKGFNPQQIHSFQSSTFLEVFGVMLVVSRSGRFYWTLLFKTFFCKKNSIFFKIHGVSPI